MEIMNNLLPWIVWLPLVLSENSTELCVRTRRATNEMDIRDYVMHMYDSRIFASDPTNVEYKMVLLSIEYSQLVFEVKFAQTYSWRDMRLAYPSGPWLTSESSYREIDYSDIWRPTISLDAFRSIIKHRRRTILNFHHFTNGTLQVVERVHVGLLCQSNFRVFPFDWPRCMMTVSLNFERDAGLRDRMTLHFRELANVTGFRVQGAHLSSVRHSSCTRFENASCTCIMFTFYREVAFFVYNGFLPSNVAVTSSFMAFWVDRSPIPPMTSARCIIGMMTRLGFMAISSNLRAQLPVQSGLMALNIWEAVCLIFIYISLIETCVVTYLERTGTPEDSFDRKAAAKMVEYLARTVLPTLFLIFNTIYFAIFIWVKYYEGQKQAYCPAVYAWERP